MCNFLQHSATSIASCSLILALATELMSFLHAMSGTVTTWLVTCELSDKVKFYCDELVGLVDSADGEVYMFSTNELFWIRGLSFVLAACFVAGAQAHMRGRDLQRALKPIRYFE